MASDVIGSEAVLKGVKDMNVNNSSPEFVTPRRTHGELANRQTSSPSSSGVSGEGDEEELDEFQNSTNGEEALGESLTKTRATPQERTSPDNEQKQPGARSSTPVSLPQPRSPPGPIGSLERQESVATTEARLRMEGVELKEEWQDEDFPRPLPEEEELEDELFAGTSEEGDPGYAMDRGKKAKKKLAAPDISLTLDRSEGSILSDELDESTELDLDDIDTPSDNSNEFEWEDDLPKPKTTELLQKGVETVQEYSASDEREEGRRWRVFRIGDQDHRVDMKAIEPYKRVISHGGYYGDGLNAIIVFAVCFMPESNQPNYRYIMDNLFKYVIGTLELLVAENYMIVYLNGATSRKKMPAVGWLRKCYQQIDRRLRKNLKSLIIVHPSWFIRTLLALTKPFISSKFSQKIKYVFSLTDLAELVPMEYVSIPDCIKQFDEEKNRKSRKRIDQDMHGKVEIAAAAVPE
ncbi:BCL2/adenovirus E1B 19 kDa protein-interacting protein 2 isoform X1 [Larimichthys crocea]|nr:BCL2/adenovirus E1B 19 kDa protein-interacting protein 2 isoform X1 [Larimichthys crocea]XP_027129008.1 BCL2/adenovirus E1B 19 kDa protein-interacting protein 2 isoform X1 [Larimichthys crocea]XP_027129009.1 BCL2/adenovirus E1B 19 kDa protein-interacting protein 2 isoform X1 [Larimichthys crocea]XP_027129010.1 BCL2/adenovirus E1B 19 kDa protein-interacting protein 2 isoform X1 [Larimichthys crocea]XP_027129011.1 BCL2/adenovirus E1B 19 kDa protein-interacting protein 2 isoform X1 [Larimichthy